VSPRRARRKGGTLKDGERRQLARASRQAGDPPPAPESNGTALVLCDGGSRGNPGPSAIAAVLLDADGHEVASAVEAIGRATAAAAEYRAILLGLELAGAHDADPIDVCSDSRLAIRALEGAAPGDEELAALVRDIRAAARRFDAIRWRWHPRADNEAADALVRDLLWST
jgi:ribonuclease HI